MGADIHLFIEYDDGKTAPITNNETSYLLTDGEFLIPRDHDLFVVLAGVRAIDDFLHCNNWDSLILTPSVSPLKL